MKKYYTLLFIFAFFASALHSDNIYLKSGDIITGQVMSFSDSSIFVQHKFKQNILVKFNISDVKKINFTVAQEKNLEIEQLKDKTYKLNVKLTEANQDYTTLSREYNEFKLRREKPYKVYVDKIANLNYLIKIDSDALQSFKKNQEVFKHNLASMEKALDEEKLKNAGLREQIKSLNTALAIVQKENKGNNGAIDERDSTISYMRQEIENLNDTISIYLDKIANESAVIVQLNKRFTQQIGSQTTDYKNYKQTSEKKVKKLQSKIETIMVKQSQAAIENEGKLEQLNTEIDNLTNRNKALNNKNEHLRRELKAAHKLNLSYVQAIKRMSKGK